MYCASACSSLRCSPCSRYTAIRRTATMCWTKACSSTTPCRSFPPRKTCCTSCARTGKYTELEARILDLALVLHAEHGGGNNSTFTTHVVTSSGTDTYSAMAASLASLKGPKHGGANIKVVQMFEDMKTECHGLDGRRGRRGLSARAAAQRSLRQSRPDLRHGPCGILPVRPARQCVQTLCGDAV